MSGLEGRENFKTQLKITLCWGSLTQNMSIKWMLHSEWLCMSPFKAYMCKDILWLWISKWIINVCIWIPVCFFEELCLSHLRIKDLSWSETQWFCLVILFKISHYYMVEGDVHTPMFLRWFSQYVLSSFLTFYWLLNGNIDPCWYKRDINAIHTHLSLWTMKTFAL